MNTPIFDFVKRYSEGNALRFHMPGHKGAELLGFEKYDITEVQGADSLYEADGIIAESERNASELFGCATYYSTEGSSHCIRAMLFLASIWAKSRGRALHVAALRNVHKAFLSAAVLNDFDISWICPKESETYLSCGSCIEEIESFFSENHKSISVLYITSPDYLGNMADIKRIAEICRKYDVLFLVDNAHGAYLKFLEPSEHPIDLGADICCDSAHKTLPSLTGGAYLHLSNRVCAELSPQAKNALALFGSSSPSYLTLASLDMTNKYLSEGYREKLKDFCKEIKQAKHSLEDFGYSFFGSEQMKLTIEAKKYGYLGTSLARILRDEGIETEFADPDYLVLMPTPELGKGGLIRLTQVLLSVKKAESIKEKAPLPRLTKKAMSPKEAMMSPSEEIPVEKSMGRVLASPGVSCPPAVPILICGEVIDENAVESFKYYGIKNISVVKK